MYLVDVLICLRTASKSDQAFIIADEVVSAICAIETILFSTFKYSTTTVYFLFILMHTETK